MSLLRNKVELTGFVNFIEPHYFKDNSFALNFSMTIPAGKSQAGEYRKEYFQVRMGSEASKKYAQKFKNGDQILLEGRLRNESYDQDGTKKYFSYVEAWDIAVLRPGVEQPQQPMQYQQPQQPMQYQQPPQYTQPPMPNGHGQQYQQQQSQQDLSHIPF